MIQYVDFLVLGWLLAEAYYRILIPRVCRTERIYTLPRDVVLQPFRRRA